MIVRLPPVPVLASLILIAVNLLSFSLMGIDKKRSKTRGARRIPERALFAAALLGGGAGAVLGMRRFRHKTKHWYFAWGMPLILLVQLALATWVLYRWYAS